jgi:hypothetical protein
MGVANPLPARLALFTLAALAMISGVAQPATASFRVSPTTVDLRRDPGGAALGTVNVRLRGERGRRYRVVVQEIRQKPDGTQVYGPATGSRYSASSWVAVSPTRFSGAPDRTQPVQYRVLVPPDAEPGDHLASLTVERLASPSGVTAAATMAISVRLTIRVAGAVRPAARIDDFDVPGVTGGDSPVAILTTVRNVGNVTLDFEGPNRGAVRILDGSEREATLPFPGRLFPGQVRVFDSHWEDPPLFGDFDAEASIRMGARAVSQRDGFWVIPWRQIVALTLIVLAVLVLALGWRRRRWGW